MDLQAATNRFDELVKHWSVHQPALVSHVREAWNEIAPLLPDLSVTDDYSTLRQRGFELELDKLTSTTAEMPEPEVALVATRIVDCLLRESQISAFWRKFGAGNASTPSNDASAERQATVSLLRECMSWTANDIATVNPNLPRIFGRLPARVSLKGLRRIRGLYLLFWLVQRGVGGRFDRGVYAPTGRIVRNVAEGHTLMWPGESYLRRGDVECLLRASTVVDSTVPDGLCMLVVPPTMGPLSGYATCAAVVNRPLPPEEEVDGMTFMFRESHLEGFDGKRINGGSRSDRNSLLSAASKGSLVYPLARPLVRLRTGEGLDVGKGPTQHDPPIAPGPWLVLDGRMVNWLRRFFLNAFHLKLGKSVAAELLRRLEQRLEASRSRISKKWSLFSSLSRKKKRKKERKDKKDKAKTQKAPKPHETQERANAVHAAQGAKPRSPSTKVRSVAKHAEAEPEPEPEPEVEEAAVTQAVDTTTLIKFLVACADGDTPAVIRLLGVDNTLVHYQVNADLLNDKQSQPLRTRGYDKGSTGLMLAAERGHHATVATLLEHGANPNWASSPGDDDPKRSVKHPLIHACMGGHWRCMRELLNKGANATAVTQMGSPLELLAHRYNIITPKTNVNQAYAVLKKHDVENKITSEGVWTEGERKQIQENLDRMRAFYADEKPLESRLTQGGTTRGIKGRRVNRHPTARQVKSRSRVESRAKTHGVQGRKKKRTRSRRPLSTTEFAISAAPARYGTETDESAVEALI